MNIVYGSHVTMSRVRVRVRVKVRFRVRIRVRVTVILEHPVYGLRPTVTSHYLGYTKK